MPLHGTVLNLSRDDTIHGGLTTPQTVKSLKRINDLHRAGRNRR